MKQSKRLVTARKLSHPSRFKRSKVITGKNMLVERKQMTVVEMYELYPRKWLVINDPIHRNTDGKVISGELLGVFSDQRSALLEFAKLNLRTCAVLNSIQEE